MSALDLAASYDAIPYPSHAIRPSHPDRLHVIGRLSGMRPALPHGCRVLELGCASGGNLIPMAAGLPKSAFVGVDLSGSQVERANETIAALDLGNVEVVQGDVRELDRGQFDYVIAHGLLTWIERETQPKLMACIRAHLAPEGIAYISYNTLPGWRTRGLLRDMMIFHVDPISQPRARVEQARHLLDYLTGLLPGDGTAYEALLRQEIARAREAGDDYLAHDHLELHNEPRYMHEVVELARVAGLHYLGESARADLPRTLLPERGLARHSDAFVRLQQYHDFVTNRSFRASLFVREEVETTTAPDPSALLPWWVEPLGRLTGATPLEVDRELDPVELGRLRALLGEGDGASAADLTAEGRRAALAAYLVQEVELWPRPIPLTCEVPERPLTSALARLQADRGEEGVTNLRHEPVPVDNFDRRLLVRLDGSRDLSALISSMIAVVEAGDLEVTRDGAPMETQELAEVFALALPKRLASLAARGLLSA